MKKYHRILATAALLAVTLGSSHALAIDAKIYGGNHCIGRTAADQPKALYLLGGVKNIATTALNISCPVVYDSIGKKIVRGMVALVDLNDNAETSCVLRSREARDGVDPTPADSLPISTVRSGVKDSSTRTRHLTFSGLGHFGDNGWYHMDCQVTGVDADTGGQSSVLFYRVDEK
jgi:hypothetical protein